MITDFRPLIGIALFIQSSGLFAAIMVNPKLADNQGFMVLATAVIVTGWVGGAVAYAFTSGIESASRSASLGKALDLVKAANDAPTGTPDDPVSVKDAPK